MNLKVVLVRLLPMKWSLTINRRTKGDGKGKGKSANSEEKEKARIAVPSLAPSLQPRYGIEPLSLSMDFIPRACIIRALALTMSGKRLIYNPLAPLLIVLLDLCTT